MSYKERIPGMKPGNRNRNIIVGSGYGLLLLFLLANFASVIALLLLLSPIIIALVIGKNYKGLASELAKLPGISDRGGIQAGISAFVYTIVLVGVLMGGLTALAPVEDTPEEETEVPEGEGEAEAEAAEEEEETKAAEDEMKTVTITVVDENGDPVENADVEFIHDDAIIFDTRENKPTNSDGVVTFETEAGSNVDVNVEADGYENTDASLTVSEDEEITLTLQEDTEDGETEATEEGDEATEDEMKTVTITVVDENGDPIENADVEFVHDDAIIFDTRENKQTGSDGIVSFETEVGSNVDINVEADGYENTDASLTVSEDEEITLTLQEEPEETGQDTESTEEDSADASEGDEAEEETEAAEEEQQNTEAEASDDSSSDESDDSSSSEGDSSDSSNSGTDETESSDAGIEVRISYSGEWSGSIGADGTSSSVDGSGDETVSMDGDPSTVSATVQKQDDSSDELTVAILEDGEVVVEESTTAEYGVVSVSEAFF